MSDTYKVIGNQRINDVEPGGIVVLDPDRVNVPALIAAGHVEPVAKYSQKKTIKGRGVTEDDGVQHDGSDDPDS